MCGRSRIYLSQELGLLSGQIPAVESTSSPLPDKQDADAKHVVLSSRVGEFNYAVQLAVFATGLIDDYYGSFHSGSASEYPVLDKWSFLDTVDRS